MTVRFTKNELEHIKSTMKVFFNTTEIPCVLIDEDGNELHEEGGKKNYCRKVAKNANDLHLCQNAHKHFGHQSEEIGEAYISYSARK